MAAVAGGCVAAGGGTVGGTEVGAMVGVGGIVGAMVGAGRIVGATVGAGGIVGVTVGAGAHATDSATSTNAMNVINVFFILSS